MGDERELAKIREALQEADDELVGALEARARAVRSFVTLRERAPDAYLSLPSRADVVQRAMDAAKEFPKEPLERVIREVLGACDALIAPNEIAVLGPAGGFAHLAAVREFGTSAVVSAVETIERVFEDVERRRASYGVVPFETSAEGAIADTIDSLLASEARICGELTLSCRYDLVSSTGNRGDVENIYGHASAIAACEATLRRELPKARLLDVKDGPYAEGLAREDHGAAAVVAGWSESDPRELRCVQARVEDKVGVDTRFVVIGHDRPKKTGRDRTVIALVVGDEPGSLYHSLKPFADRGINLSRIESRPAPGSSSWRFVFILELDGHVTDRSVVTAVDEVQRMSRHLQVLGSFPLPAA